MIYTREEWIAKGTELFGEDMSDWKFKCKFCKGVQSVESIRKQVAEGIKSQRHGLLKKGDSIRPEKECYGEKCNYVAWGLIGTGIHVVSDSSKPYDVQNRENIIEVMPFAEE